MDLVPTTIATLVFFGCLAGILGSLLAAYLPGLGLILVQGMDFTFVLLVCWSATQGAGRVKLAWMVTAALSVLAFGLLGAFAGGSPGWVVMFTAAVPVFMGLTEFEEQHRPRPDPLAPQELARVLAEPPGAATDLEPVLGEIKRPPTP